MFKANKESIALFGGSFDPPHFGHKDIVEEAIKSLDITKLIIIPTFLNPFKQHSHYSPLERLVMSKELFKEFLNIEISDYEIKQDKSTPTYKTVKYFQQRYSVKYVIIGADNLRTIDRWEKFQWLNSKITWVVATRVGYDLDTSKLRDFKILRVNANISSTEIREKKDIDEFR